MRPNRFIKALQSFEMVIYWKYLHNVDILKAAIQRLS
jgi:hypothetical protein